ncbi:MAG: type II toxin-antitoxin system VapC family toxin [Comamonadaceae bacterium]|nr:type II toxin-antitoxin system VapC family toxin [Comamonadaceae bacterium]
MPFVLDNSVVTGWYLADQANAYTESIAVLLENDKALVPALWQLELANVLKTACTRGKLSTDAARQILDTLALLPIDIYAGPAPGQRQLFELAMRHQLSSYDAAYLELALRFGMPLATQDHQLKAAAVTAGVNVL